MSGTQPAVVHALNGASGGALPDGQGALPDRTGQRLHSLSEVLDPRPTRSCAWATWQAPGSGPRASTPSTSRSPAASAPASSSCSVAPRAWARRRWRCRCCATPSPPTARAVFFSYEHDAHGMLERLLAIEAGAIAGTDAVSLTKIRAGFEARHSATHTMEERFADDRRWSRRRSRRSRATATGSTVHTSSGMHTTLEEIRQVVRRRHRARRPGTRWCWSTTSRRCPSPGGPGSEDERVTRDRRAAQGPRARGRGAGGGHRGRREGQPPAGKRMRVTTCAARPPWPTRPTSSSSSTTSTTSSPSTTSSTTSSNAERFRHWVVMSIEKNRNGVDQIDLEFRKRFEQGRFEPEGRVGRGAADRGARLQRVGSPDVATDRRTVRTVLAVLACVLLVGLVWVGSRDSTTAEPGVQPGSGQSAGGEPSAPSSTATPAGCRRSVSRTCHPRHARP